MLKHPTTWIGIIIILAAGIYSSVTLIQYRNALVSVSPRLQLVTGGVFLVPVVTALAIFLWYYFNERV